MIELFRMREEAKEPKKKEPADLLSPNRVSIIINEIQVGFIQEFIVTEFRGRRDIQIDLSRILDANDTLEKVLGMNKKEPLTIQVLEERSDHFVHFQLNECTVERISRCYNAEKDFTMEDCTILSTSYYKNSIEK